MNQKKVEVLITTLNMKNWKKLIKKMNIQSSAMIGNQCNKNSFSTVEYEDKHIKIYSFNEKGVGLNRNNLLMRASGDYCLFGDDDLCYIDDYEDLVCKSFLKYKDADILIFNLEEENRTRYTITKPFKVNAFNFMRFGAARIAVRRDKILLNGISFNTCFGGGTQYSNGEDTLFLADCIKRKLKIYAVPETIAKLIEDRESTWFKGYDKKYLMDKGILYYVMSKKFYKVLCLQDAIRHTKDYMSKGILNNYKIMIRGIERIKNNQES